jgi:hypothetical protein
VSSVDDEYDSDNDEHEGSGLRTDLLASYLAFGIRAVSRRRYLVAAVFLSVIGLTVAVVALWPRTYRCESKLMIAQNRVLETRGDDWNEAFRGAGDVILRRENLEAIIKQADLVRLWNERRVFVLRLKDAVMEKVRGKPTEKEVMEGLVWTLGNKLSAENVAAALTITAEWPDAETASRIVQAAEDNFLESRHVTEVSTYSEYISILESHAETIRSEVDTIAAQIRKLRGEKVAAAETRAGAKASTALLPVMRRAIPRAAAEPVDEELPRMKADVEAKKRAIAELEDLRTRRLMESQAKLAELQTRYTSAHPAVLDAQQTILSLSRESPQVTALRGELRDLEGRVQHQAVADQAATGSGTGYLTTTAAGAAPAPGLLPTEIMSLMEETSDDLDPAVAAQLRYAVDKYSALRSQISSARIDLDTAQAAFKHRYKIVVPPEVPQKALKPKIPLIVGAGIASAIFLALLVAIAAELRSGRIVERWQVQQLALPVLAELQFPPRSSD